MKPFLSLILFFLSCYLFGEEDLLDMENLDDLLNTENTVNEEQQTPSVLDSLLHETGLTLSESINLRLGYAPGWTDPDFQRNISGVPILKMSGALIMDFQMTSHLRAYHKISWSYPDFPLEISEFFVDYDFTKNINMRFGKQVIGWGESRNFEHSDILDRIPDGYAGDTDPLALRLSMPLRAGSIDFLVLTRKGFWNEVPSGEDPYPSLGDLGYGGKINLPIKNWDFSLYSYYHNDMFMRSVFNYKTTLLTKLEHYSEFMLISDMTPETSEDKRLWFSGNTAFYTDFLDGRLKTGGEYYYNGEESELETIKDGFLLYPGHNAALFTSLRPKNADKMEFLFYGRLHPESGTGVLSPGFKWNSREDLEVQGGLVYVYGDESQGYRLPEGNPDPLDRPLILFLSLRFHGQWKQHF